MRSVAVRRLIIALCARSCWTRFASYYDERICMPKRFEPVSARNAWCQVMFGDEKHHSSYAAWIQALHISLASAFLPIQAYLLRVHVPGRRKERSPEGNSPGCEAPVKVPSLLSGRF